MVDLSSGYCDPRPVVELRIGQVFALGDPLRAAGCAPSLIHSSAPSAARLSHRRDPPQPREAAEIAVRCHPLAAPLDRERGKPGVGDASADRPRVEAEAADDVPMPRAGLDDWQCGWPRRSSQKPNASASELGFWKKRSPVVIRTTALSATGESPKRMSPSTHVMSHAAPCRCGKHRSARSRPAASFRAPHPLDIFDVVMLLDGREAR